MKEIIETLFKFDRHLIGAGMDNSLEFINHLIPLDIIEVPSGTQLETWTVPDEWIVRDAWVKNPQGEKIIDYKVNPLSLTIGSIPVHGTVKLDELMSHVSFIDEQPNETPYTFKFYDKGWGFNVPKNQVKGINLEAMAGVKLEDGKEFIPKFKNILPEGDYEVFIDSEYRQGTMKIGVHTIPGKSNKEILLFAHLDHPYQANDNLSGVACLVDLAMKVKSDKTIKIVFCPETIGSIAYALTQDISKVEFMIAVDICGNDGTVMLQRSLMEHKINSVVNLALKHMGQTYNIGKFRTTIGSDEYVFNDPSIDIAGIMLSRFPYKEYHTSSDTPDKINYSKIEEMQKIILKTIEYWDMDYIPKREFKGQLCRSKYGIQTPNPQINLSLDYFFYGVDGKKSVAELCTLYGLNFQWMYDALNKMIQDGKISKVSSTPVSKVRKQKTKKQK